MGDIFTAIDFVAGTLFAAALAMIALTHKEVQAARVMIWIAVVLFIGRWGVWAVTTDQPWYIRMIVGAIIGGFLLAAIPAALAWIREQPTGNKPTAVAAEKTMTIEKKIDNRGGIYNEGNNSGTQTVINQAPEPELKMISQSRAPNSDGSFTSSVMVEVVAPYTPGNLTIEAYASGIQSLEVRPQSAGLYAEGHSGLRQDMAFTNISGPHGKYLIVVTTKQLADVRVDWSFK